jgi:riboflavin kinase/FMN adenylyltransferase
MSLAVQVFRSLLDAETAGSLRGCAVAIGNFDGVHMGHRRLLAAARILASDRGKPSVVLTFEPHPVRVLRPALAPPLVTSLPRKLELLAGCGIESTVVQPFDLAYAQTAAEDFVDRDLVGRLGAAEVVVGYDFTAGHERARVDRLRRLLRARGADLHVVDPVTSDGLVVSSTKIREFLLEGNVGAAALLLTRPHDLDGVVAPGAGRGRAFGFPTANVRTDGLLPANGVYAVRAWVGGRIAPDGFSLEGAARHDGVCNVGVKPTVETNGAVVAEAHIFDFDGRDLYGERIRLAFVARLRDERRFSSVDALRAQIADDAERARRLLEAAPPATG